MDLNTILTIVTGTLVVVLGYLFFVAKLPKISRTWMSVFTQEFKSFLKEIFICSWRGHQMGKWEEVYWAERN